MTGHEAVDAPLNLLQAGSALVSRKKLKRKQLREIPPLPLQSEQDLVRHVRRVSDLVARNMRLDEAKLILQGIRGGIRSINDTAHREEIVTLPVLSATLNLLFTRPFADLLKQHCLAECLIGTVGAMKDANPVLIVISDQPFDAIKALASGHAAGVHDAVRIPAHYMMKRWTEERTAAADLRLRAGAALIPQRSMERSMNGRKTGIAVSPVYAHGI